MFINYLLLELESDVQMLCASASSRMSVGTVGEKIHCHLPRAVCEIAQRGNGCQVVQVISDSSG